MARQELTFGGNRLTFGGVVLVFGTDAPVTPPAPRGDDAFRSSGQRDRFWQERAEEELAELLDRVDVAAEAAERAPEAIVEAFALVDWEALPAAPRTREMLAALSVPQPDYTIIAALVLAQRQEIEAARVRRRRKRDIEAVLLLS